MDNDPYHSSPFYPPPSRPLPLYRPLPQPQQRMMGGGAPTATGSLPHILMSSPPPAPPPPTSHHSFPSSSNSMSQQQYIVSPQAQPTNWPQQLPQQQLRRYRTIKRLVQIPQGKLVLDCPVPVQYLERVPVRDPREFNMMRYTAITCDASEFVQKKYTLRQEIMKRETEIVICITMYNVCFYYFNTLFMKQ